MYLFSCPACDKSSPIPASKAGQTIPCPECGQPLELPKLGELKKLPPAESSDGRSGSGSGNSVGAGMGFALCIMIAIGCGLVGGMCAIRWALEDVTINTEQHIAETGQAYSKARAAELIRDYEQMDTIPIELATPFNYQIALDRKNAWGFNALVSGLIGLAAVSIAMLLGSFSKSN